MILNEFERKKSVFDILMYFLKRILSFIFIYIIFKSISYHKSYLTKIEFDNCFLTNYFKKIDNRRKFRHQHSLLPLKKIEKINIIDPTSSKHGRNENRGITLHLAKLLLEILSATCFIMLDRLYYECLDLVGRHARIDYEQEGIHEVHLLVLVLN